MNRSLGLSAFLLLVAAGLVPLTASAQADPGQANSGRAINLQKDSAAGRVVSVEYQGQFSYVRIEAREPGAETNQHPFTIAPAALRASLASVQFSGAKPEPLFNDAELDEISAPLSRALAKATAEQDVSFAVSGRHGFLGPLAPRVVTTGRVFRRASQLEVVFGMVRRDFESQFRGTGYLIPFEPGQRQRAIDPQARLVVASGGGTSKRPDWVALNLEAPAAVAQPSPAGAAPAAPAAPAASPATTTTPAPAVTAPAPTAVAPAPANAPTPAPLVAPAPAQRVAPPAAAQPEANAIYRNVSERLKALKKLRDDGLISEKEYQDKRRAILKEM